MKNQAEKILELAELKGVSDNFFFANTFKNYLRQLKYLDELDATLEEDGVKVKKEYVKGRQNVYSHPALADFMRTNDSSCKSVSTMLKIIKQFGAEKDKEDDDALMDIINGDFDE